MKHILFIIVTILPLMGQAQDYRLSYDERSVPELFNTATIYLEKKEGSAYKLVRRGYRLSTEDALLEGNKLIFDPGRLREAGGVIRFQIRVDGREIPLTLQMPILQDIRFNLYSDSIKPILNYYVNVEGVYSSGKIYPLTTDQISLSSDYGSMSGNEWIPPKTRDFDRVIFTAQSLSNPGLKKTQTVYLKRYQDPRDAEGYEEETGRSIREGRTR